MALVETNLILLLQQVNSAFTSITGQSISFIDQSGEWKIPLNYNLFTDFCKYIITSPEGSTLCRDCNHAFEDISGTDAKICQCHMGITMISVPINLGQGSDMLITNAQFLLEGTDKDFYNRLPANAERLGLDVGRLRKYAKKLKTMSCADAMARTQFLKILAQYVSITEAELQTRKSYYESQNKKYELENRLKDLEFKFLQSQISPHFLFNTLNLLTRMAHQEGAPKTAALIYDLADLLRWGYKNKNSVCRLEEELDCVMSYLRIQMQRLGDLLQVSVKIDPECKRFLLPVLTIQPLVENIIVHGLKDGGPVLASIHIFKDGTKVTIKIQDDGTGIPPVVLAKLNKGEKVSGTGIENVVKRILLYFNNQASFSIRNREARGTEVTIICPQETGQ